jgi:hypothetical protein
MSIPGLDARGVTPELKLRQKFCCSWTWWFFWFCFLFVGLFVILLWIFYFYFYSYFLFFFLYYQFHHHYLLIPILTPSFSLLLLCYNPLFSFSTTLSAPSYLLSSLAFTFPSYSPLTCHHTNPPSYTFTNCCPDYCTNFTQLQTPAIRDTLQQQIYTQTHPRATKPINLHITSPTHPPYFLLPLLVSP